MSVLDHIEALPDKHPVLWVDYHHDGWPNKKSLCTTDDLKRLVRDYRRLLAAAQRANGGYQGLDELNSVIRECEK